MNALGNKEIFSKNLKYYMELYHKTRLDLCNDLNIKYSTIRDWVNGNAFPRIDKIELLASYFQIQKSDLIEKKDILITEIEKSAKLTNQILSLANNEIEKELLISCTMLEQKEQKIILDMVKLYLEKK